MAEDCLDILMTEPIQEMMKKRNPCSYELPCRDDSIVSRRAVRGREPNSYDALPRDVKYSFMPPAYYAKGFRILSAYKREFDFTEMRKLLFLEDPEKVKKWGTLRARLPYPESRVVDLPGTRDLNYKNYCMRSLAPESAMSWRNSIKRPLLDKMNMAIGLAGPEANKPAVTTCSNKICPFK